MQGAVARIVLNLEITRNGTFDGMTDVVHHNGIAIIPATHIVLAKGRPIVTPKRLVEQKPPFVLGREGNAASVEKKIECQRLKEQSFPVKGFLGSAHEFGVWLGKRVIETVGNGHDVARGRERGNSRQWWFEAGRGGRVRKTGKGRGGESRRKFVGKDRDDGTDQKKGKAGSANYVS